MTYDMKAEVTKIAVDNTDTIREALTEISDIEGDIQSLLAKLAMVKTDLIIALEASDITAGHMRYSLRARKGARTRRRKARR